MFRIKSQEVCFEIILGLRCQLRFFYVILYDVWVTIVVGTNMITHDKCFFCGNLVIIWWLVETCTQNLMYPIQKNCIFLETKLKRLCKGTKPQNNFCIWVKLFNELELQGLWF
jgi:hypothetical protein